MNRGCVAVGEIKCDNCQRLIEAGQRYLVVEKKEGEKSQFCVECSVAKGYAAYVKEKGEEVLTFFPVTIDSTPGPSG
jgi:ribosomal protein S26